MFKKIISVLLVISLVFALAGCGKNKNKAVEKPSEEIVASEKKVAILVAPAEQYPEDYKAAKYLEKTYPDSVIVKEYSESRGLLKVEQPDIVKYAVELAEDETVGAILFARATQHTQEAAKKAKAVNSSLYIAAIEPEVSLFDVATECNFTLTADWNQFAPAIVDKAKDMGANKLLFFSNNRHLTNPLYATVKQDVVSECEDKSVEYIEQVINDPIYSGIDQVNGQTAELIDSLIAAGTIDKNTCIFSTDSSIQKTLVEKADKYGLIYVCPSFPTAYNGIGEYFDIKAPSDYIDVDTYISNATTAVKDSDGKFAMLNFPLMTVLVKGAVYTLFDMLNGKTTEKNLKERLSMRLTDTANFKDFEVGTYIGPDNTYKVFVKGFEELKAK